MITVRFVFIICLINCFSYSQKIKINGVLFEKINSNDSIILLSDSSIKDEYYEKTYLIREIKNNSFYLKNEITYPQMFRVRLKSETNKIPNRRGFYFLDKTSTYIKIDSLKIAGEVVGEIGNEFKNEFTPFFIKDNTNQDNFDSILFKENNFFDIKLLDYVIKHNNSFIALWFFIYDFSNTGYSDLKNKILNSFSIKMKSEKLWKIAYNDFHKIKIKENQKFPKLLLKNTNLQPEKLTIPKAKYTLVDFWFSRCRPCLEEMPIWINLYNLYNSKGFNVIGISSDKTENVKPYWQKRIIEKGIPWKNYLDENAIFCTSEKINSFPTNFLLNEKGEVIQKNIQPEDLEKILSENLK